MHQADNPITLAGASPQAMSVQAWRHGLMAAADPWLAKREVAAYRGVSTATIDRMIKRGDFPRGEAVSPGRVAWRLSVVEAAPLPTRVPRGGKLQRKGEGGRA